MESLAGRTDGHLLGRFQAGEGGLVPAAFESLVAWHGSMAFSPCRDILDDHHAAEGAFLVLLKRGDAICY